MDAGILEKLKSTKEFVNNFCAKILSAEENENAKQVFFLDNKPQVEESMKFLTDLKGMFDSLGDEIAEGSEEEKVYELSAALINKITKTMTDYKNSFTQIKADVTVDETIKSVNEETIKQAMASDKSTQQLAKDMNELSQKQTASNLQEFTHAILVGGKFQYYKPVDKNDLNAIVNEVAAANPNDVPQVFEVEFKPVTVKRKAVYVVQ